MKNIIDLTDLFVTKEEALDLLGDLMPNSSTNLFGEVKTAKPKPRPKWQIDGFTVLRREHVCINCKTVHIDTNQYILVSESLVDADGNTVRSHKTANPNALRQKDIDYEALNVTFESVPSEPVNFCNSCPTSNQDVYAAFFAQQKAILRKEVDECAAIERELLDLIKQLED